MGEEEDKAAAEKKAAEEKEAAEKKVAEEEANKSEGNSSAPSSKIEEAKAERAKMEATVETLKKENDRTEQLQADAILAGKGEIQKTQTEDDKWATEAKERYAGTGMDPTPDDTPVKYS